jgi:phage host-nuclease inhibitor protein Gam
MAKKANARITTEAAEHFVPESKEAAAEAIKELGFHLNERKRLEACMNDEILAVRGRYESDARVHGERANDLMQGIKLFCEARRAELTADGRKSFTFTTGEIGWRRRPPSIVVRKAEQLIEWLKGQGLARFVRAKEEVDKEALGRELEIASTLPGVSVSQKEDFWVKPADAELEAVG